MAKTPLPSFNNNISSSSANSYPWDSADQYFGNSSVSNVNDKTHHLLINPLPDFGTLEPLGISLCSQVTPPAGLNIG